MWILKKRGYQAENIVKNFYLNKGLHFIKANWTIPGGEIDLIFESEQELIFIEVKCINTIEELDHYISSKKIKTLERAIESYLLNHDNKKDIRLDIAFVKNDEIIEIYENISNS